MKIAVCLYGQPRDYKNGHACIDNLIKKNDENTYDFFFHCWIDDNIEYDVSPWREIDKNTLIIKNENVVKHDLSQMYEPKSYLYEKPLDRNKEELLNEMEYIKKSKAYANSNNRKKDNIYNTFSQIYSRNKVKDLFEEYITTTKTHYDYVISTRFDGLDIPKEVKLTNIQQSKIYTSSIHRPRYIIPDNFLIIPPEIYINWFNIYKNIKNIINNEEIELKMNNTKEKLEFNMEELLLSNYLFCGYDVNDIEYVLGR